MSILLLFECYILNNIDSTFELITVSIPPISTLLKQLAFCLNGDHFLAELIFLREPALTSVPRHLENQMKRHLNLAKYFGDRYLLMCLASAVGYNLLPLITDKPLPIPFTLLHASLYQPGIYLLEICYLLNGTANNCCLDYLALNCMCVIRGQICVLNGKLREARVICKEEKDLNVELVRYISACVEQHAKIIELVELTEKVFSEIVLIQYLTSIAAICIIGFRMVTVDLVSFPFLLMAAFLLCMFCQLGIYCWFGNEIILQSLLTREACYEFDWINADLQVKNMLLIIMERSKRPLHLTAGKFSILSLDSFTSVINSAYTFFAVIQTKYSQSSSHNL
ncbi:odorant receptor 49b [Dendroctonus ponderosae]|nr:odorant receptor 49b [Dendroctonus ponderosae]